MRKPYGYVCEDSDGVEFNGHNEFSGCRTGFPVYRDPLNLEWADYLAVSEAPSVDECIRNFLEDQTEDNAVCMVREIIEQAAKHASK